jgi:hypothetical protein
MSAVEVSFATACKQTLLTTTLEVAVAPKAGVWPAQPSGFSV